MEPRPTIRISVPLAGSLVIVGLLGALSVACSGTGAAPADLILVDGTVIVAAGPDAGGDGNVETVEALAVADGRVLAAGSRDAIERHRGPDTRVVELGGATVIPAFVDHHLHLLNTGMSLLQRQREDGPFLDLSGLTPEEIAAAAAERATGLPEGAWLLGKGWSQGVWGAVELPDSDVLDEAVPGTPVFLTRVDGHAGWASAAALEAAGIDASTPDPEGGAIPRRPDGSPRGTLLERANELLAPQLPEPEDADVVAAFRAATDALAAQGVTEVFDAGFLAVPGIVALNLDLQRYLELIVAADDEAPLPLDVHLMVPAPSDLANELVAGPAGDRRRSPRIDITHIKLFADGAMGSRGAWLSHPFADLPDTHGVPRMGETEIRDWTRRALDAGLDVATHAIGDAALHATLNAYAAVLEERPELDPARLRVEHVSYGSRADLERAADLGIVLSIKPNFVLPDDQGTTMEDARIGDGAGRVYAWGSLAELGARLAGGTDYFTVPMAPLFSFHAAATRENADHRPDGGWHPDQRLDRIATLRLLTATHAPGGGEPRGATLRPGDDATLAVLSADPLEVAENDILDISVLATLRRGEPVHDDGTLTGLGPGPEQEDPEEP